MRLTKNGKQFGIFTLSDFKDNSKFYFFRDLEKYVHILNNESAVMLTVKVSEKRYAPEEFEASLEHIELLEDAWKGKSLKIQIDIENVVSEFITELTNILVNNSGETPLGINVVSKESSVNLDFAAKKFRVNVSNQFFNELEKLNVRYLN